MPSIDGKRVSRSWGIVLSAAKKEVNFLLEQGQRTLAEQAHFWAGSPTNPARTWNGNLAARPTPFAPHIKQGREDHALDVNQLDGGVYRLAAWLKKHGVEMAWTVIGEAWHIEAKSEAALIALAKKLQSPFAGLKSDEERWVEEYIHLKKHNRDRARRRVLRRAMKQRREEIWRAANGKMKGAKPGWNVLNRRYRFKILYRYS